MVVDYVVIICCYKAVFALRHPNSVELNYVNWTTDLFLVQFRPLDVNTC